MLQRKTRKLQFRRLDTGEIVGKEVDATGRTEREVETMTLSMLWNMHRDLYVHDTADDETDFRRLEG